jgi:alkanesulfonate monooxygenase SsuD/methylene tetrahydromethanopterin reductase-like flavin-dependent oxidoreductase (luciferase family)
MVKSWLFDLVPYPELDPPAVDPQRAAQLLEEHLQIWTEAEAQGFAGVFLGEHHFTPYSLSPSPNLLVAALAQRTQTLRIGIMCNILPMHDPRRLAEEGSMLDLLSGGRLEFGLGRGADEHEFIKIGMPMEETRPRLREGTELIVRAWTQDTFSYDGEYYRIGESTLVPRPLQQPHPPIWVTATVTPATVQWAAENGFSITTLFISAEQLRDVQDKYHAWAAAAGRQTGPEHIGLARQMYVAESEQQALEECAAAFEYFILQFRNVALFGDPDNLPGGYELYKEFLGPFYTDVPPEFSALVDAGLVWCGTPEQVREQIVEQVRASGCGNVLLQSAIGNLGSEQVRRSHRLFAEHVLPTLAGLDVRLAPAG